MHQSATLNMSANLENTQVATGLQKVNLFPTLKKGSMKEYSNHGTVALMFHASKWSEVTQSCPTLCNPMDCSLPHSSGHGIFQARILECIDISKAMLKILHARLQHYMNQELPDIQAGFTKGRGTIDHIANICWIMEKARKFQKKYLPVSSTTPKSDCMDHNNCGKLLKRWEYQTILLVSWETWMQIKKQHLESHMEQVTCSRLRKEYNKAVNCHPFYLPYLLSTSWGMPGWMSYKLVSR